MRMGQCDVCLAGYHTPQGMATDTMKQEHSLEVTLNSVLK
jgi:hypothetical protein